MREGAKKQNMVLQWLAFQFLETPKALLSVWKNFLLFGLNYFSISLLLRTFFSPWHRYTTPYGKGFDFGRWSEAFLSNLIFRILGALTRSVFIFIGLLAEVFILCFGFLVLFLWLFLPFLLIFGIYHGFRIFF